MASACTFLCLRWEALITASCHIEPHTIDRCWAKRISLGTNIKEEEEEEEEEDDRLTTGAELSADGVPPASS